MKIKRIDHIAIVVDDIDNALGFWRDALGLNLSHVEDVPDQRSVVAFLPTGASEVELVKPTSRDTGVARFLEKRGPGIHHICFEVEDIEDALASLKADGIRLINETPQIGTGGKKIAFIHPESTHGVLVELYELTGQEPEVRLARARRLADRVLAGGQAMANSALEFLRGLGGNSR
ncbi:MAG: methylmalonyl-CoA epimerase [Chloroflexi bacterium]|nr:methylmalonyl-CoA epimerase [Chloroflexota bacterium]